MKNFKNYSSLLNYDCSSDYWADLGADEASEILEQFSSSDWEALKEEYSNKTQSWKTRCADSLSETKSDNAIPILLHFLNSADNDVVEASIESINSLLHFGTQIHLDEPQIEIIKRYAASDEIISDAAKQLLETVTNSV